MTIMGLVPIVAWGEAVVRTHNTPRTFQRPASRSEWEARVREIREQILVSAGLWPLPPRPPLRVHRFDRSEYAGFTVEKVLLETWPGFYLGGNLYTPNGHGPGPFPAVLNPHGHWARGRATESADGSVPARCIHFARQGMLAFVYDMVGYGDSWFAPQPAASPEAPDFYQRHRQFPDTPATRLWNVNLLGFQLWNSLRALDFLCSLPEVDTNRIGVTGASGGGSQTFLLAAVDDRPKVLAPVCMVSHSMQGGCVCENAPGLRIRFSNLDLAAAAAPRPQLLVAATGDWTRTTLEIEGPAVQSVYQLLGAADRIRYLRFDAGHNYNRASREAVYAWFERWLLDRPDRLQSSEAPYEPLPERALFLGSDPRRPEPSLTADGLVRSWIEARRRMLEELWPRTPEDLRSFQLVARSLWYHTLQVGPGSLPPRVAFTPLQSDEWTRQFRFEIRDPEQPGAIEGIYVAPGPRARRPDRSAWLILHPEDLDPDTLRPSRVEWFQQLVRSGHSFITITRFTPVPTQTHAEHFFTYNRTLLQARVRDLITVATTVATLGPSDAPPRRRLLWGTGQAGLWVLLAAPAAEAVICDLNHRDLTDETLLTQPEFFCPGFLAMGGATTPVLLAAPRPVLLARPAGSFPVEFMQKLYADLGRRRAFQTLETPPGVEEVLRWLKRL